VVAWRERVAAEFVVEDAWTGVLDGAGDADAMVTAWNR